jgi:hypothetical protein
MALLEDVFKLEGAAGPVVLGVGFLFAPTLLPVVGRVLRPLAKEGHQGWDCRLRRSQWGGLRGL